MQIYSQTNKYLMIIETLQIIFKPILIAYIFTRFAPIQDKLQAIKDRIYEKQLSSKLVTLVSLLIKLLSCSLCISFWVSMYMTGSIYISTICYIIMKVYENKFSNWEHQIKLK